MSKNRSNFKISRREQSQSQRQLKVSQVINAALVECLRREGRISRVLDGCPLTITKVNMSPDLRIANCYFLPFNTDLQAEQILDALEESKYVIRDYVTREVHLKFSPEIRFFYDEGFENAQRIEELLRNKGK